MPNSIDSKNIEELLAQADELLQRINSDSIKDMKEEHRLEFEKHAQKLEMIKSDIRRKDENKIGSGSEGMHEAIEDIVKAMGDFAKYVA